MLLSIHPELVHLERCEPGFTENPHAAMGAIFEGGVDSVSANGVIGDPARSSAEHGDRYWQKVETIALQIVER